MRRTIVSTILFSSLLFTAAASASSPPGDSPVPTRRVSTGITPPQLLTPININLADKFPSTPLPTDTQISVTFVVDQNGATRDVQITRGFDLVWNARVVAAISKLHYRPATLDNQPVPMQMNLVINLAR